MTISSIVHPEGEGSGRKPTRWCAGSVEQGIDSVQVVDRAALEAGTDLGDRRRNIGSEVASRGNKRGVDVTVVEAWPTPLVLATRTEMGAAIALVRERRRTSRQKPGSTASRSYTPLGLARARRMSSFAGGPACGQLA